MPRVKSIAAKRHRKVKSLARGFKHARSRRVKNAKESLLHAGQYAYHGRKLKKRDLRSLWIMRINAGVRKHELTYGKFISGLKKANIILDRKILSDLAIKDSATFGKIVDTVKKSIAK